MTATNCKPTLIVGEASRIIVTIARSLARCRVPVFVAALPTGGGTLGSNAVRCTIALPDPAQPEAFVNALVDVLKREGIDTIMTDSDAAMRAIAGRYDTVSALAHPGCPVPDAVARVLDKAATLEAARACGIDVPATYEITDGATLAAMRDSIQFPIVAKPRRAGAGVAFKVRYFPAFEDLSRLFEARPLFGHETIFQQFLPGEGIGIETIIHDGAPVAVFQHRRLKELPPSGGVSVLAEAQPVDPRLASLALDLLASIGWSGVAMVEFRRDAASGKCALMEINGRFWGTLPLAVAAGLDFPRYQWESAHGRRPKVPDAYAVGIRSRWFRGDLLRLTSVLAHRETTDAPYPDRGSEFMRFVRDFNRITRSALWSWQDPAPALIDTLTCLPNVAGRVLAVVGRRLLRSGLRSRIKQLLSLDRRGRWTYLRLWSLRAAGLRRDRGRLASVPVRNVVFVCSGNIIRSPLAEAALRKRWLDGRSDGITIASSGLHAISGCGADPRALVAAAELGFSLESHTARVVDAEQIREADAIFVMDYLSEAKLVARYPNAARKVFLLGAFAKRPARSNMEISDPDLGTLQDVRQRYASLVECVDGVASVMNLQPPGQR